jgi:hypothetical protein
MFGKQLIAHTGNSAAGIAAGGLDRQIAFGIEPDRPVVEIGRAHADEQVIDDDELGMHEDLLRAAFRRDLRIPDAQAPELVSSLEPAGEPVAVESHDQSLKQSARSMRHQHNDLRAVLPGKTSGEHITDI